MTGATGFIGRSLVKALAEYGCHPVLLTRPGLAEAGGAAEDGFLRVPLDLSAPDLMPALRRAGPITTLFHLAGTRGRGNAGSPAVTCAEVNALATVRLLHAATVLGVRRVIIVGSAAEYGSQPGPLREDLPLRPTSAYGISKAAATNFALAMHRSDGCPVVVIRPFTVYGPGQPADMFVAEAVRHAVLGIPFRMSHGRHRQDLVFVDDLVRALLSAAAVPGLEGGVFNVGGGTAHRLRDIATLIWELSRTESPLLLGGRPAEEDPNDPSADITAARRVLGWAPAVDLKSGLAETIRAAREQGPDRPPHYHN